MAYNANIPQATDQLNVSQSDILNNFQALAPFGSGYALLANTTPTPGTDATHVALYAQLVSGALQLFFERESNATPINFTSFLGALNGGTVLPSGIIIKWGFVSGAAGSQTVVFPTLTDIPAFTTIFFIVTSPRGGASPNADVAATITNQAASNFVVNLTKRTAITPLAFDFNYFAIGM